MKKGMIKATGPFERVVHWCLALSCLFLCITGMGMMYHSLNFIGTIFGGMGNLKVIHNYTGIFFGVSLLFAIVMWWKEAGLFSFPEDGQWFAAAGGYLWHVDNMPEVGKYNPGQKMFFLAVALFGIAMVVSGLIMWFPLGYSVEMVRWMFALHALGYVVIFAFFFIPSLPGHHRCARLGPGDVFRLGDQGLGQGPASEMVEGNGEGRDTRCVWRRQGLR